MTTPLLGILQKLCFPPRRDFSSTIEFRQPKLSKHVSTNHQPFSLILTDHGVHVRHRVADLHKKIGIVHVLKPTMRLFILARKCDVVNCYKYCKLYDAFQATNIAFIASSEIQLTTSSNYIQLDDLK